MKILLEDCLADIFTLSVQYSLLEYAQCDNIQKVT